jgi:hypothetical protein
MNAMRLDNCQLLDLIINYQLFEKGSGILDKRNLAMQEVFRRKLFAISKLSVFFIGQCGALPLL